MRLVIRYGQTDHLMCDGARHHVCWNGVTIDGPLAAAKIAEAASREFETLEDFDSVFLKMLNKEAEQAGELIDVEIARIRSDLEQTERAAVNLLQYLKEGSQSELVRNELELVEHDPARLKLAIAEATRTRPMAIVLPTAEVLRALYYQQFRGAAVDSYEFAGHLRQLIPRLVVFPYQLCDGGKVVLRARFRLQLASLIPDIGTRAVLQKPLERVREVDLFDMPQRAMHLQAVAELRGSLTERDAVKRLGLTITAAQKASALQRLMCHMGIADPYLPVIAPDDCAKLRRHQHPRYKFEPLGDAGIV